jgi:hypothetical protein
LNLTSSKLFTNKDNETRTKAKRLVDGHTSVNLWRKEEKEEKKKRKKNIKNIKNRKRKKKAKEICYMFASSTKASSFV